MTITREEYNEWIKEMCKEFLELIGMKDINYLHGGLNERKFLTITITDRHLSIIGEGRIGVCFDDVSNSLEERIALAYADWKGEDTDFQITEEIFPFSELEVGDVVQIETSSAFIGDRAHEFLGFTGYMTPSSDTPYRCAAFRELGTGTIRMYHDNPTYSNGKTFKPSVKYAKGYKEYVEEEKAD